MNKPENYSDEHISAYIDGELDCDERMQLFCAEQQDELLAQRINNARMLKEKIQLSYCDVASPHAINKSFNCGAFAWGHRTFVAGLMMVAVVLSALTYNFDSENNLAVAKLLIKNTSPINASLLSSSVGDDKKIIINVSQYQPHSFSENIKSIEALLHQNKDDRNFKVEIVASGQGVKAFDTMTSTHVESISALVEEFDSVDVIVCAKSLARLASDDHPIKLLKSIMTTPSVLQRVAERTNEGWHYLKL